MRRYVITLAVGLVVVAVWAIPQIAIVPAATGTYENASARIVDAGLRVSAMSASNEATVPQGTEAVVGQSPRAGSLSTHGTTVTLRVRPLRATVVVPDVVGLHVSAASKAIHEAGLNLGGVDYGRSIVVNDGIIVATAPTGGQVVPFDSNVGYALKLGP